MLNTLVDKHTFTTFTSNFIQATNQKKTKISDDWKKLNLHSNRWKDNIKMEFISTRSHTYNTMPHT